MDIKLKKIKTAWLNFILHISAKINKSKGAIVDGGILKTLGVALKIVLLELLLLIVSLPIYIFISPMSFSKDKGEVQKYRLKRIISLVTVCTFIVIFLVTSILSGGIFLVAPVSELRADSIGWGFDNPKDYIYDLSKIQIVDGLVLFKPSEIEVKSLTEGLEESPPFKESLLEKLAESTTETPAESTAPETTAPETTAASTTELPKESTTEPPTETTAETTAGTTSETTAETVPIKSSTEKLSATCKATIQAVNSLIVPNVARWDSFIEVSGKNGGEIYYQLSDDGGQSWYYWNNKWVKAGENDYNTAKEINEKIRDFPINTGQILFKAFFITDFKSEMQLLDISIAFGQKIDETMPQQDAGGKSNQAPTADAGGPYSVEVNSTVKIDGSASSDMDGSIISYKWKIIEGPGSLTGNNSPIVTYKAPKKLDSEMKVTVELTVVDDNKESAAATAIIAVVLVADEAPTFTSAAITGTAKVGEELTATGESYNDVNGDQKGEPLYQWMICGTVGGTYTNISGATNSAYTPLVGDIAKFIKVIVTPVALTGISPGTPVTSSATSAVIENTFSLSLGSAFNEISDGMIKLIKDYYNKYGKYPRSWSPYNFTDIGLVESEWTVARNNIIYSPTGNRLNIKPEEGYGFEVVKATGEKVRMSYKLKYNFVYYVEEGIWYYSKQDISNVIEMSTFKIYSTDTGEIINEQAVPVFTSAAITGTAKVGVTLTAEGLGYSDINGDLTGTPLYQWAISDTEDGTYANISGATSSTYTPVIADLAKFIKVKVTPAALTGTSPGSPITSVATAAVKAAEAAPIFTNAAITGIGKVGATLTASGVGYSDINDDLEGTPLYQWTICSTATGAYANISGATSSTYTPVIGDLAKFIKVKVTPTALTGTSPGTPVISAATAAVFTPPEAAPTFTGAAITGTAKIGIALTAEGLGYSDVNEDLAATPLYQWVICSTIGGTYTNISGATSSTYIPVIGYLGKFIKVKVTPTALTGTSPGTPVISAATAAVKAAEAAPTFTGAAITGTAKVGVALSASGIGYSDVNGDLAATPLYQWTICSTASGTYADIPDAIGSTYTPASADLAKFIKVKVTPTALTGTSPGSPVTSAATAAVKAAEAAPTFTGAAITGTAKVGVALSASGLGYSDINGDLAGTPLYQWMISDTASGTYADIPDAIGSTYTPASADLAKFIKVKVTPVAKTGTLQGLPVTSVATTAVKIAEAAPTFTGAAITGTAKVGVALSASGLGYNDINGDLAGTPLYQWTISDTADGTYINISGATSSTYVAVIGYLGKFIKVKVTPVAKTGTSPGTPVESVATAAIKEAEAAPTFTGAAITGTAKVGVALSASGLGYSDINGDLPGTPLYQWMISSTANGTYANISGATSSSYTPVIGYLAKFIKVSVTPKALTGTLQGLPVISDATEAVLAAEAAPTFTGAAITGTAKVGVALSAEGLGYSDINGDLAGTPLYQWMISSTIGGTYANISGATSSTYTPVIGYLAKFIKVKVTPVALTGTLQGLPVTSAATAAVSAAEAAPTFTSAAITGTAKVGVALSASGIGYSDVNGDLTGIPLYQWTISNTATGAYIDISGATSSTYTPVSTDLAKFIKVKVTPTALTGTSPGTPVTSSATASILAALAAAPIFTSAAITGTAKVGAALTAEGLGYSDINGDLAGTPLYQWMISDTADGTYSDISGATNSTYTPASTDLAKFIKVKVTPTALTGTSPGTPVTSAATTAVLAAEAAPAFSSAAITGTAKVGVALSASGLGYSDINGDLAGTPLYQWMISDTADGTYSDIAGATNNTYTPVIADLAKFIKVIVTPVALTGTTKGIPVESAATATVKAAEAPPAFSSAAITGTGKVGTELTAIGMEYSDVNDDLAGTPLYQWTICDTSNGTYTDISGATSSTYTPASTDLAKFIKVKLTPTALTGTSSGIPVESVAIEVNDGKPKITINSISQLSDEGYVYIYYKLIDPETHLIDLSNYEYSLTGDFNGEESSMTAAASDNEHDGFKELSSSAAGIEHTFVWDALADLPGAHNLNVYIRLKPDAGIEQGDFASGNAYITGVKKPSISNISALQTAGTNKVVVSYDLSADNDRLLVGLEISEDGGTTWTALVTSAITGDMGPEITKGTGKTIIWDAAANFEGKDKSDIQIRLTATGAWQNTSDYAYSPYFALDTKAPLGLNNFLGVSADKSSIVWSWTPVSLETNFKYYKIFYGKNLEDVRNATSTALVWDTSNDVDLSVMGTAGTIITGLSEGTKYYARIWAIDNFGNEATVAESQFITKNTQDDSAANPPFTPILNQPPSSSNQSGILVSGIADINSDNDLYVDGEIVIPGFAQTQSNGKFNGIIKLEEGKHEIYVMSKDGDGNSSKCSNTINVDIDFGLGDMLVSETILIKTDKTETDEATIIKDVYKAAESQVLQRPQVIQVKGIDAGNNIKIIGKGVANSEVIVFIHSEQVIAYRVQVNENGDWSLIHSQDNVELAEGDHEVYALTLDAKSQAKSRISDIKKFQVKVNRLAIVLSYFDLPTTLLTIFVLLMGIVIFGIWRRKQARTNKRKQQH